MRQICGRSHVYVCIVWVCVCEQLRILLYKLHTQNTGLKKKSLTKLPLKKKINTPFVSCDLMPSHTPPFPCTKTNTPQVSYPVA